MEDKICSLIRGFFTEKSDKICPKKEEQCNFNYEIYNEFSLQHELGIYLREKLGENYKVLFEKNICWIPQTAVNEDWCKKEIDITVMKKSGSEWKPSFAIELKFPQNGAYPKRMFQFIEDMQFMEQAIDCCNFESTYCIALVHDVKFFSDKDGKIENTGIYGYFRKQSTIPANEEIPWPINDGKNESIALTREHKISWEEINGNSNLKYYIDAIR